MKIDSGNIRVRISVGDGGSFSSGGRATIEDAGAMADERGNELRGFILNDAEAGSERRGSRDITPLASSRGRQQSAGSEFGSFGADLGFRFRTAKADCGDRNRLIVPANADGGIESVSLGPAFDEPQWMCAVAGERCG